MASEPSTDRDMRSISRTLCLLGGLTLGTAGLGPSGLAAQVRVIRPQMVEAPTRFEGRAVASPAGESLEARVRLISPLTVPQPSPPLPGTPYAEVNAVRLFVPGKLEVWAMGVLATPGDSSGALTMLPSRHEIIVAPPHVRLAVIGTAGAFYIIRCRIPMGSDIYVHPGAMALSPAGDALKHPDASREITFLLDNAVAGKNYFSLHSPSYWSWQGCEVRQLS
jgi:hypothetical protein